MIAAVPGTGITNPTMVTEAELAASREITDIDHSDPSLFLLAWVATVYDWFPTPTTMRVAHTLAELCRNSDHRGFTLDATTRNVVLARARLRNSDLTRALAVLTDAALLTWAQADRWADPRIRLTLPDSQARRVFTRQRMAAARAGAQATATSAMAPRGGRDAGEPTR